MRVVKALVILLLGGGLVFANGCASVGKQEPVMPRDSREQQQVAKLENLLSKKQEQIDQLKKRIEVLEQELKKLNEDVSTLRIISSAEVRIKDRLLEIIVGDRAEIVANIKPASAVPFVSFEIEDPNIATVEPLSASSTLQTLHIFGIKQGETCLIARVEKRLCAKVTIKIRQPSLVMKLNKALKSGWDTLVVFWKTHVSKPPVAVEEVAKPREEKVVEPPKKEVLRSTLPGRWYPADPEGLAKQVKGFLKKAGTNREIDNVMALILPHAGYRYSGQTAAKGVKTATKKYKRIVIIGPSHRLAMPGLLSVPKVTHYETPLGQIPLDLEFIDKLLKHSLFQNVPKAHTYEHSVQIELPLLQCTYTDFKLVPIVAGRCSLRQIIKAGEVLKGLLDQETLVIASSDFVHYGPNYGYVPFTRDVPEKIKKLDLDAYKFIAAVDCKGFLEYKRETGTTICGYVPIAILLAALPASARSHLVAQTCSGEIVGDFRNSVSYLSVAFCGNWPKHPEAQPDSKSDDSRLNEPSPSDGLGEEDKKQLLTLARRSLLHYLEKRQVLDTSELDIELSKAMSEKRAAFVTLKRNSRLRGCIGDLVPRQALYRSVIRNAANAGFNDRRFTPLEKSEYEKITIEISALTPPMPVVFPDEIRLGIDGVILRKDGRSAVFLPQVASEQGWSLEQMLSRLSLKAGLPADAWKNNAHFLVFQAEVFSENER